MAVTIKMTGLTEHFSLSEYSKHQTGTVEVSAEALLHAQCMEEFRQWLGKPMTVNGWYRTASYNKKVGGNTKSSHLRGAATDWGNPGVSKDDFVKYAKKWRDICKSHRVVGEAGLYTWGIHIGSSVKYSKTFYHWDTRSGKQVNLPFKELK